MCSNWVCLLNAAYFLSCQLLKNWHWACGPTLLCINNHTLLQFFLPAPHPCCSQHKTSPILQFIQRLRADSSLSLAFCTPRVSSFFTLRELQLVGPQGESAHLWLGYTSQAGHQPSRVFTPSCHGVCNFCFFSVCGTLSCYCFKCSHQPIHLHMLVVLLGLFLLRNLI